MRKIILSIFATVTLVTACNEDLLNTTNPNQITNVDYFKTLDQIGTATTGIYAAFQGNQMAGR